MYRFVLPLLVAPSIAAAQQQPPALHAPHATPSARAATAGAIEGRVTSPKGEPLSDVMVVLRNADGTPGVRGAQTDNDGRFVIPNVPAGSWTLVARRVGLAEATRTVTVDGGAQTVELTLAEQATVVAPMVVSASKERQRRTESSATIDVVDGAEVRLARAAHPAQIMKRVPGVYVGQLSAEGHNMAIRQPIGTKPLYLYLEDGIPTRATGFFNHNALYEVNLPQSGGIEVLKGPGTALYGSDAIGGVINVLTRPAPTKPSGELSLEGGDGGYRRMLATAGNTWGANGLRTDLNLTDVSGAGRRDDSPYHRYSGTVRWDHFGTVNARTVVTGSTIDQNDALSLDSLRWTARSTANRSPLAFRKVRALRASTALEKESGATLVSVTPYARYDVLSILPNWQLSYDPQTYTTRNYSLGVLARVRREIVPLKTKLIAGLDVDYSPGSFLAKQAILTKSGTGGAAIYQSYKDGATQYDYDVTYRSASPYVQAELSPLPTLHIDAGVRYDASGYLYDTHLAPVDTGAHRVPASTTRDYSRVSPKIGASWELSRAVALYGSYRTGFRAPSQGQLFTQGSALNTVDLKPVKVASWEGGVRGQVGRRLVYQVAAYDMTLKDDIITFIDASARRIATNAGETRHKGIETSVGAALLPSLRLDVAQSVSSQKYVTWVPQAARAATSTKPAVAEVRYDGNTIEAAPRDLSNVLLTWSPAPLQGGRVAAEWTHTGRYFTDAQNTHSYAGYDIVNLHANYVVRPNLELFGRMVNVTNAVYAEVVSFDAVQGQQFTPGTPRTIYAGVRVGR
ncbi:TonB-dependent receptor [Gemmatirosa kalamazoonensis]|uniref:TonB-dependent receptor n=1 Tax=Gemmatirosa kalamazoonensis TaxID=861299 RepID=W0R9D0_9BACT|nr:TonB-dependent receptor [Gemmatirosa kalamazoonensis]AHG87689.1 TonB-dependent receptor [Gemmatirosa kalamazoonensis]